MKKVSTEFTKALNYAFVLLKFRKRYGRELRARLEARGYGSGDIEAVLAYLENKHFINGANGLSETEEAAEVAAAAAAKLKKLPPERARKRLFTYLSSRGFPAPIIADVVDKTLQDNDLLNNPHP